MVIMQAPAPSEGGGIAGELDRLRGRSLMATPESVTRGMSPLRRALHRLEDRRAVVLAPDREPCPARPGFRTQARRAPPDPTLAPSAGPEAVSGRFWPFAGESGPVGSSVSATGDPTRPAVPPDSDLIRRIRAARPPRGGPPGPAMGGAGGWRHVRIRAAGPADRGGRRRVRSSRLLQRWRLAYFSHFGNPAIDR